jgi:hypothetical protein
MIRIAHITDPELKARVVAALAERRGMSPGMIPEWFELDEADFVDLLNDIRDEGNGDSGPEDHNESRM